MNKLKILNLYAGIGGNRKLWGDEYDITAIEIVPEIANIYKDLYPHDTVIIEDAHEFLRKHFREFDFIWASPPCPTHSVLQMTRFYDENLKYPDMTLYQEIIWLQTFFKGKWVIENVKPYYEPLIAPTFQIDRHYFWSSDFILTRLLSYRGGIRLLEIIINLWKKHMALIYLNIRARQKYAKF